METMSDIKELTGSFTRLRGLIDASGCMGAEIGPINGSDSGDAVLNVLELPEGLPLRLLSAVRYQCP